MAKFVEYQPDRGVETWEDMTVDGRLQVHYRQDVEPILEYTKRLRNDGLTDHGIKDEFWHYAQIPPVIIMKLRFEHGVDVFNPDHMPKVFEIINRDYPYLKTTNKTHVVKH